MTTLNRAPDRHRIFEKAIFAVVVSATWIIPLAFNRSLMDLFTTPKAVAAWVGASILLLIIAAGLLSERRFSYPRGRIPLLTVGFAALLTMATIASVNPAISLFGQRQSYLGLTTFLSAILFSYAAWSSISPERLRAFISLAAGGSVPVAALAIAQRFGVNYPFDYTAWMTDRFGSTIGNPNFLGIYLAMTLPLVLALLLTADPQRPERAAFLGAVTVLEVAAIVGTRSLGAIPAAAAAAAIVIIAHIRPGQDRRRRAVTLAAAGLGVAAIVSALYLTTDVPQSLAERTAVWTAGAKAVTEAPALGRGPDALRYVLPNMISRGGNSSEVYGDTHNLMITLAAAAGLPAALVFLLLIGSLLSLKTDIANDDRILAVGIRAALAAYLIGQSFNPESIAPMTLFWILAGVLARQGVPPVEARVKTRLPGAIACAGALVLSFWLITAASNLWQAESLIKAADTQSDPETAWRLAAESQRHWPYYDFYSLLLFDRSASLIGKEPRITKTATGLLDKTIAANGLQADAYYARGEIHRILAEDSGSPSETRDALHDYRLSLKHNRFKAPANYEIAKLYLARGDKTKAKYHLDVLLSILPADDEHRPELLRLRKEARER